MFNKIKQFIAEKAAKSLFKYVLNLIIDLVLKRLQKYMDRVDWSLIKDDVTTFIKWKIRNVFLADICIAVAEKVLHVFEQLFLDIVYCKKLREHLAKGDFDAAKKLVWEYVRVWIL